MPVRHQRPHRRRELRGGGLEPTEEQRHVEADELRFGQLVVVVAGVHQHAEEVVGFVRASFGDETRHVAGQIGLRLVALLRRAARPGHLVDPVPELRDVGFAHAEDPREPVSGTFHAAV